MPRTMAHEDEDWGPRFSLGRQPEGRTHAQQAAHQTSAAPTTWQLTLPIWQLEDRPEQYLNEAGVNSMTVRDFIDLKKIYDEGQKRDDRGEETFRRDPDLPTRSFDGGPDNCADLLHPAR